VLGFPSRPEFGKTRKLKAEAEKAAAADNRSLAGLIVKLLRDYPAQKPGQRKRP